ncbi:MAG: aspartate 1-decarboxylase [bacterium]|nr:aspartate 1-decarboxylase [bacterium]
MYRQMMKSKIHRAVVTESNLHYVGSITIDKELMEKADIMENEKVMIVNLDNGARLETYAISGKRGSGVICTNGGGARLTLAGDIIVILAFGSYSEVELETYRPNILFMDKNNKIASMHHSEESHS